MRETRNAPKGWHSRGYLPHFDSPERIQHVVFRTAGSLPKALLVDEAGGVDRIDDLARTIDYVERNPVAAGLAASPEDWPWSSARLRGEKERA